MNWRNILVIRNPITSAFVTLTAVIMALAAWFAIHSAVSRDQENWLQTQTIAVEDAINQKFSSYVSMLLQTRASFMTNSAEDFAKFAPYVKKLEIDKRYPGILTVSYAKQIKHSELNEHLREMRKLYPKYKIWPAGKRAVYTPVVAVEPLDHRNHMALGFDLSTVPARAEALQAAADTDTASLSAPVRLVRDQNSPVDVPGFLLVVPLYSKLNPKTIEERHKFLLGYVFTPIHATAFVEATFGKPHLNNERVNFTLTYVSDKDSRTFYERFAPQKVGKPALAMEKMLTGPLSSWRLRVESLPHSFPLYYRVFPDLVGLFFLFGAALIIYSIQNTSRQFFIEDEFKDQLIRSEQQVRTFSETLLRLNRASKAIFSEINLQELIKKIALVSADVAQAPSVAVFTLGSAEDDTVLNLRFQHGNDDVKFTSSEIPTSDFESWIGSNVYGVLHSGSMGASLVAARLFKQPPTTWVLIPILKRTTQILSFIVAYSNRPIRIDEQTISILEGLSSQIATALENSFLFARAEESNRLKSSFLANMSHEIRTPLGAIIGYADMLARESLQPGSRREINLNMRKNADQLTRIIDDILDLSKVEANKLDIIYKPVSLPSLLTEIKSLMDMRANDKAIRFVIVFESQVPQVIESDETRLKQILSNLIGNAIKFTEKGRVLLSVSYDQYMRQLRMKISDSGCGISEEAQRRLFQPFSQGDTSNTRRFGGTGLGLVLSRRLAQLLGGDVELTKSVPAEGTEFLVTINADFDVKAGWVTKLQKEISDNEINIPPHGLADRRILLVEDSQDNQEIFRFFLEAAGAKVTVAESGVEALEKTKGNNFDLILMDIQIPELDGKEATKILRQRGWKKPIVALTAHGLTEERESVLAAGCNGQITKPVTGDQLIHRVNEILQNQATI